MVSKRKKECFVSLKKVIVYINITVLYLLYRLSNFRGTTEKRLQLIETAIIGYMLYNHFMYIPPKQEHINALETIKVNAVKPPDETFSLFEH